MRRFLSMSTLVVSSFLGSIGYSVDAVLWDAQNAVLAGNGCTKDVDAFITTNGNDLSIVFTNLGVNLPGGMSPQLADRKTCAARIGATIAGGRYIGELTQRVTYGVIKSAPSTGSLAIRSTFFNFGVSPHSVVIPRRTLNEPLLTTSRTDKFAVGTSWFGGWCNPNRNPKGLYNANLAVAGQKDRASENLIMFVDGLDLKYEVLAALAVCRL